MHAYITVDGKALKLTNLEKAFFPTGFTKGDVIGYYRKVAPVVLPYLRERPFTLRRFPAGVGGPSFFEKRCPPHRPAWATTGEFEGVNYCLVNDMASLLWVANLAAIELHPTLARIEDIERPTSVVFDLDPGEGAGFQDCCETALLIDELLMDFGLQTFAKTSGSKGLHLYVPLNDKNATYAETTPFARWVAEKLERSYPDRVTSHMAKKLRPGKVLIDWSQNVDFKTTVCVYSLRARERPTVSAPLKGSEVLAAAKSEARAKELLHLETRQVFDRLDKLGDLFTPVLSLRQQLPVMGRHQAAA